MLSEDMHAEMVVVVYLSAGCLASVKAPKEGDLRVARDSLGRPEVRTLASRGLTSHRPCPQELL